VSDIFFSYAREDQAGAKQVVNALESKGWSIFWDPKIVPGQTWDQMLQKELDAARCVIVLWSRYSVRSEGVSNEAHEGKRRGILVPALIDNVPVESIPLWFRRIQAANLVGWSGNLPHAGFEDLTHAVEGILGKPASRHTEAPAVTAAASALAAAAAPPSALPKRSSLRRNEQIGDIDQADSGQAQPGAYVETGWRNLLVDRRGRSRSLGRRWSCRFR
jgi:TIR domain